MATEHILIVGAIFFGCGSAGLFLVHLNHPRLMGLGWLSAAFAAGGVGALLLLSYPRCPVLLSIVLADDLILLSYVLLHVAALELSDSHSLFPSLGAVLLLLQLLTGLYVVYGDGRIHIRIVVVGLLIAVQSGQTAHRLVRAGGRNIRAPAWFCATILICFAFFNLARSLADSIGALKDRQLFYRVEVATFVLYLAVGLGIAFGFFWMTTSILTERLEQLAETDPLTRVYNRRAFLKWCERERLRSQQATSSFSILMIDLDHFKSVNDNFGHPAGDAALCAAVEKMQDAVRETDIIGRWGGEEFAALLPDAAMEEALMIAQRVCRDIEAIALFSSTDDEPPETIRITVSVGVATYRTGENDVEAVLRRADTALYEAKMAGRNRVLAIS